ncbi:unnamed protein product [Auanema sp. JU1783]|nr:unnamed protein product [Auanema sp. JU1783]
MTDNSEWINQNLQRQRRMLEEKQRMKRVCSPNIRSNQNAYTRLENSDGNDTYPAFNQGFSDTGLSLFASSVSSKAETTETVKKETPSPEGSPQTAGSFPFSTSNNSFSNQSQEGKDDNDEVHRLLLGKLEKAEISSVVTSDDETGATGTVTTGPDGLETHTLPVTLQPDYDEIAADVEGFVKSPAKGNRIYRCSITRDKKGMDKGIYPTYYLHLEREEKKKGIFLLAARRRKKSTTANYLISCDATDLSRDGTSFMGKVRCNAMGTTFVIYNGGQNPKKCNSLEVRQELAAVLYDTNVLGFRGPRKMTVVIPGVYDPHIASSFKRIPIQPVDERDTLVERFKRTRGDRDTNSQIVVMSNKPPVWNEDSQSYVLNFHGRVTQASVKNFQIIHPSDPEYIVMQFGRISEDTFSMDFRYPLSAIQAFGIAMTSFHGKIACE